MLAPLTLSPSQKPPVLCAPGQITCNWSSHQLQLAEGAATFRPPQLWACLHCPVKDSPLLLACPFQLPSPHPKSTVRGDDILLESTLSLIISMKTLTVGRENPGRSSGHPREPGLATWGLGKASQTVRHRLVYEVGPETQTTPGCQGARAVYTSMILSWRRGVGSSREPPRYQGTK